MAKRLKSFEFKSRGRGRYSDLDKYLDGYIWQLDKNDISTSLNSTRCGLYDRAKKLNLKIRMNVDKKKNLLTIQAYRKETNNETSMEQTSS